MQLICDREAGIMFDALCYPISHDLDAEQAILSIREAMYCDHEFLPDQIEKAIEKLK